MSDDEEDILEEDVDVDADADEIEDEEEEEEIPEDEDVPKVIKSGKILDHKHVRVKVRDPKLQITSNMLTDHELTEVINIRITQLNNQSPVFVDITGCVTTEEQAWREVAEARCPLVICREVASYVENGVRVEEVEYIRVNEASLPEIAKSMVPANVKLSDAVFNRHVKTA